MVKSEQNFLKIFIFSQIFTIFCNLEAHRGSRPKCASMASASTLHFSLPLPLPLLEAEAEAMASRSGSGSVGNTASTQWKW
jgi:hypothetical protein